MTNDFLIKLFEHNHWANQQIIHACAALSDDQLDAQPLTTTKGTIRHTLIHLVQSQRGYLALLTVPVSERPTAPVSFDGLLESVRHSGEGFLTLLSSPDNNRFGSTLQTTDGYFVAPWVVIVQAINHATEHREQINSMLTALGITPPILDGWVYGEAKKALVPIQ